MAELGAATASGGHTPDLSVQGPRGVRVEPLGLRGSHTAQAQQRKGSGARGWQMRHLLASV